MTAKGISTNMSLDAVLAEFLVAEEQGEPQNHAAWIARYPNYATELESYFAYNNKIKDLFDPRPSTTVDFIRRGNLNETESFSGTRRPTRHIASPGDVLNIHGARLQVLYVKQGGMGCVYIVRDALSHDETPKLAIKTVLAFEDWRAKQATDDRSLYARYAALNFRFELEARNWVRLPSHPNILDATFVREIAGRPHLFLEYADSGDLSEWIGSSRMTVELAVDFALQVCVAMTHAKKSAGLVHRDIKPSNILVHSDRRIKIADFGLARAFYQDESGCVAGNVSNAQHSHSVLGGGTRAYMPPEQFVSLHDADMRSDIFSFGATLFEMLTSRRMFANLDPYNAYVLGDIPPLAHEANERVPETMGRIIAKCVAFDPQERFQSFKELAVVLDETGICKRTLVRRSSADQLRGAPRSSEQFRRDLITLVGLRQFEEAAQLAQEAVTSYPNDASHWASQGRALAELGRYSEALPSLERAVQLRPHDAHLWSDLALVLDGMNRFDEATRAAEKATELDSHCSEAWDALGHCRARGSNEDAIVCHQRAVEIDDQNWSALNNLGVALSREGRDDEALRYFEKSLAVNGESLTWFQIALLKGLRGEFDVAFKAIDCCLQVDGEHSPSWLLRGLLLYQTAQERYEEEMAAVSCLRRGIELSNAVDIDNDSLVKTAVDVIREVEAKW